MIGIGVPFTGLALVLVLLATAGTGLWLAVGEPLARRDAPIARRHLGRNLLLGALGVVVLLGAIEGLFGIEDWAPPPPAPEALAGSWQDGPVRLDLRLDGTYHFSGGPSGRYGVRASTGTWRPEEGRGILLEDGAGGAAPPLRLVVAGSEYRLIAEPGDPDSWDHHLGFRRSPPAEAAR